MNVKEQLMKQIKREQKLARKPLWQYCGVTISSWTKSEARAIFKKRFNSIKHEIKRVS